MSRSHRLYLTDILTAIQRINSLLQEIGIESLNQGEPIADAVLYNLITIGEAAKNVPEPIRNLAPEVNWKNMARFRDFVAHHYFDVKTGKIQSIVQEDLPILQTQIDHLLTIVKDD